MTSGSKTEILYFTSPRTARKGNSDLSKGEMNWIPQGKPSGNYLD
ncbi:MAG: hypothetical protein TRG1_1955 [Flavobacteriaceae bacterium FS1-H7996/R]|nr:MAG: hypothetical protein TRG1_1955 [Flavobacteriaceae bacterium FS1-H7996/R]